MKELGPLVALSAILFSLHPGLPPDTLTQQPVTEAKVAALRDGIELAGIRLIGRGRLDKGQFPKYPDLDPQKLRDLMFPETR